MAKTKKQKIGGNILADKPDENEENKFHIDEHDSTSTSQTNY